MAPGDGLVSRATASDRFRRIVTIVPWIAAHDGPTVSDVCDRFSIGRDELLADLDVVFMVGIPPYTPDQLIDVVIEDDRVWIRLGDAFRRPVRLTTVEALGLVAAGRGLLAASPADLRQTLSGALDKLADALGSGSVDRLDVDLGGADEDVLETLVRSARNHRRVELCYYTSASDEQTTRVIDPYAVYTRDGHWYVLAWCHRAEGERVFRVDRIRSASALDQPFDDPGLVEIPSTVPDSAAHPTLTLTVPPSGRWAADEFRGHDVEELADGGLRLCLTVGGDAWLERLLLRLGPGATVERPRRGVTTAVMPEQAATTLRRAANSILDRYR